MLSPSPTGGVKHGVPFEFLQVCLNQLDVLIGTRGWTRSRRALAVDGPGFCFDFVGKKCNSSNNPRVYLVNVRRANGIAHESFTSRLQKPHSGDWVPRALLVIVKLHSYISCAKVLSFGDGLWDPRSAETALT